MFAETKSEIIAINGGIGLQDLDDQLIMNLVNDARLVRKMAYAPYSGFAVGAALLCENGEIYKGCNVENVTFGATNCAERTAVFSAVAAGNRKFRAIAIAAGDDLILPCGICRQVLAEFSPDILIFCAKKDGCQCFHLDELLPHGFDRFCCGEDDKHV